MEITLIKDVSQPNAPDHQVSGVNSLPSGEK